MLIEHDALRAHWYVVAESPDVTGGPVGLRLLGQDLVLWRDPDGSVVAAPDRCPHRESPLSLGTVDDGCLRCPYHGWTFGRLGRCTTVPSAGPGRPVPPAAHLRTLHVQERYGLVWVCPGEPTAPVPRITCDDDPGVRRINTGVATWRVSATRMVDNFCDIAHFPYVHARTLGGDPDDPVPAFEVVQLDDDFVGYRYEVDVANTDGAAASGSDAPVVGRGMTTGFALPFTVRSTIHYETGLDHVLLLCSTPADDVTSLFTFVVWRNDVDPPHGPPRPAEEVIAFDRAIGEEDRVMLERIGGVLPLGAGGVVDTRADRLSVAWRRGLADLLATGAVGSASTGPSGGASGVEVAVDDVDAAVAVVGDPLVVGDDDRRGAT